jgi:hypothetical protein
LGRDGVNGGKYCKREECEPYKERRVGQVHGVVNLKTIKINCSETVIFTSINFQCFI